MSSGYLCQIFKVKGGVLDDLISAEAEFDNLECVDNQHFIDSWRAGSNSVFQFDDSGSIYYPGSIPDSPNMVVYKVEREGGSPEEIINANICVQDFLIIGLGGVFYTGNTCEEGGHSGRTGFFRYIAPNNAQVIEIARDWWDFIFDTSATEAENGQSSDQAVFFGPDPRSASTASWETACLFKFDPSEADPQERVDGIITCGDDIWQWLWMERSVDVGTYGRGLRHGSPSGDDLAKLPQWKQELKRRCESDEEIFAGGGSQISAIRQNGAGEVSVIGNIRKKNAGTLSCNIELRGPHCTIDGNPVLYEDFETQSVDYKTDCAANAGTWVDRGYCITDNTHQNSTACIADGDTWEVYSEHYGQIEGAICSKAETGDRATWWNTNLTWTSSGDVANTFITQNLDCQPEGGSRGGNDWTNEYKALAKVDDTKQTLNLLPTETEQPIDVWILGDIIYYSSFDATQGQYLLNRMDENPQCVNGNVSEEDSCSTTWSNRRCVVPSVSTAAACTATSGYYWSHYASTTILSDFEAYNLAATVNSTTELWIDSLDFRDNFYKFGTVNVERKAISLEPGLAGTLKTIVILNE